MCMCVCVCVCVCECKDERVCKYKYVCKYIYVCIYIRGEDLKGGTGWLRLVGSLKLQVSFAENRLFHRALLQKKPMI